MADNLPGVGPDDREAEEQIRTILSHYNPVPTQRFYNKMKNAPWAASEGAASRGRRGSRLHLPRLRLGWAVGALLVFLAVGYLAFPVLGSLAQQLMQFFVPAPEDSLAVQVTVPPAAGTPGPDGWRSFTLSIENAEEKAGFRLFQVYSLPGGFTLQGAYYDPVLEAVTLLYTRENEKVYFTQRLAGEIDEYSSIGASAPVEQVLVGEAQGEYVRGGWRMAPESEQRLETSVPGTQVHLGLYWDPNLAQRTLRWQNGERRLELQWLGSRDVDQQVLVDIALGIR